VYREWQARSPGSRKLAIVRPTVVFGERNRGNVYNLLKMIASERFVMVGRGENIKSMAYVENVAAFLQSCLELPAGSHLFNYVDKPDFTMKQLVDFVRARLGRSAGRSLTIPYGLAYLGGRLFDLAATVMRRELPVSSLRIRKFCATTQFAADRLGQMGFSAPVGLPEALERTLDFEFLRSKDAGEDAGPLFESE
jgi:nucleoside-diphosphate-sugar epimerase